MAYTQIAEGQLTDHKDNEFHHDLFAILGDVRSLFANPAASGTTQVDRSRRAQTWTYSKEVSDWDDKPFAVGLMGGVALHLDGTDEELDTPDTAYMSFGDGSADEPFSIVALIKPDVNDAAMVIAAKESSATAEEWRLELTSSGHPAIVLTDESATAIISRRDATAIGTGWVLLGMIYDATTVVGGLDLYVNAAVVDDTDDSSGTYVAMEDTAAILSIGARYSTKERFFNGSIAFVAVCQGALSIDEHWAVKELVNAYYGPDVAL